MSHNNNNKEEGGDQQDGTSSKGNRPERSQRGSQQRNNYRFPPHNNNNGDVSPQPPPPLDFCGRPRLMRPPCNGNASTVKSPPGHWHFFTRHRPFGELAGPYQFPPPHRFPQEFQFGTFPGRNGPRFHPRGRDNPGPRVGYPSDDRNVHNDNLRECPKDVRPKTETFLYNKKKKFNKKKYSPHGASRNSEVKNIGCRENDCSSESSVACLHNDLDRHTTPCDPNEIDDSHGLKLSKSCDGSWLKEVSASVSASDPDAETTEQGAVGGVADNACGPNDVCSPSDKDLFDEGAIFDLDNIFQNRECFSKDNNLVTNLECDDDLDFVFDLEPRSEKAPLSSDSESENGACSGKGFPNGRKSVSSWNGRKDSSSGNCSRGFINRSSSGTRNGIESREIQRSGNERNDAGVDSDCGEDNGDFIDTDLPSHNKHILSSSDEAVSSADEGDGNGDEKKLRSVHKHKKNNSDFNSNDLSTLDPNIYNGFRNLNVERECEESAILIHRDGCERPSLCDGFTSNCDLKGRLSPAVSPNVDKNSKKCKCDCRQREYSHLNGNRPLSVSIHGRCKSDREQFTNHFTPPANTLPNTDRISQSHTSHSLPSTLKCFHHRLNRTRPSADHNPKFRHQSQNEDDKFPVATGGLNCQPVNNPYDYLVEGATSIAEGTGECRATSFDSSRRHNHNHLSNGFEDEENSSEASVTGGDELKDSHDASNVQNESVASNSGYEGEQDKRSEQKMTCAENSSVVSEDFMNGDSSSDLDLVLLPMEEEIEPVHYYDGVGGGDVVSDVETDDVMLSFNLPLPVVDRSAPNPPHNYEEFLEPHMRDQFSSGNRLPSKEFYELIKTVSATDSCMRFFDKDGQDVQRSTPKARRQDDNGIKDKQARKSCGTKTDGLKVDRVMIWNEYEAYVVQYKQIAVSACGQTAILNVLKALKFQCEKSVVCKVIKTNLRREDQDIPHYLFSRACAGTTAVELIAGVERLTGGVIGGRFFHFWPPRKVKLLQWLAHWMKKGAIPMATLNLQQGPHLVWEVPDSWHHQMVYGVSYQGLYLTNPLEIMSERSVLKQLLSDSVLLVRRQDIVSRYWESTDLGQLLDHPNPRWTSMNVLGQVVNVLRECNMPSMPGYRLQVTSHVKIPACYQAGITLFMRKDQPAWNSLISASELPLE